MSKENDEFFEKQSRDPTHQSFSKGKIHPDDEGDIGIRIAADIVKNVIVIEFAKPVVWFALPPEEARGFIDLMSKKLGELNADQ